MYGRVTDGHRERLLGLGVTWLGGGVGTHEGQVPQPCSSSAAVPRPWAEATCWDLPPWWPKQAALSEQPLTSQPRAERALCSLSIRAESPQPQQVSWPQLPAQSQGRG